jgi:hypothetical protein
MDDGRIAAARSKNMSRFDEDVISPRPLESGSDISLPYLLNSKSTTSQPPIAQHISTSCETATAFMKLPDEVIKLFVSLDPQIHNLPF